MQKNYSYKDCYQILGVNPDCSWSELRKAYKKSIQKWHPDRFEDSTPEKSAADDKIKVINIAYNHVAKFYRKEGRLPPISIGGGQEYANSIRKPGVEAATQRQPIRASDESTLKTATRPLSKGRNYKQTITIIVIIVGMPIVYFNDIYELNESATIHLKQPINQHKIKLDQYSTHASGNVGDIQSASSETISNKSDKKIESEQEEIKETYFTNGSSLSEVIGVQGTPTRTDGDVWFYGESEVHFKNGVVTHWIRNSETPLKAHMSIDQLK